MENPFIFNAASNLSNEMLMQMFIADHNYSRFIESKRNVFLWGERGCGKTMTLLYNRISLQEKASKNLFEGQPIAYIPVYVSCITPLTFKREYQLLENSFKAAVVSEHYISLSIALSLVDSLINIPNLKEHLSSKDLTPNFEYIFDSELPPGNDPVTRLKRFITKNFIHTQKEINRPESDGFYNDTFTFTSIVVPLIDLLKENKQLKDTHFIFMLDDAHDLNDFQKQALNSWVSYRDNSSFSFKISAAKTPAYNLATSSGGSILPGHDYVNVDIEQPFQNSDSAFGQMAIKIISKRLELAGVKVNNPHEFFPTHPDMIRDLQSAKDEAKSKAIIKYGQKNSKPINDYVYKYTRAIYFRNRSPKANRPPYSGLETIINLSSGVIRNLLEPCYIMYEDVLSGGKSEFNEITPSIQANVIGRLSDNYWQRLRDGIDSEISGHTEEHGKQIENLFHKLAELFRKRLLDEGCSEPRAISFTISAKSEATMNDLTPILTLARRSQLLYVRSGSAKDDGAKEDYYTPNKMLWPARGLDPVGQHARVSIQAKHLLNAAVNRVSIPYTPESLKNEKQVELFNHE